ncbi:MAG: DNA-directed RNA polymerase subunit delta [Negativicutes bacterium]|jgi:DNA-directed RNA polymerase subunit delta
MAKKAKKVVELVEEVVVATDSSAIRKPGMRDIEVVYQILKNEKRALFFRELLSKTIEGRDGIHDHSWAHVMSEIFTQMNMDSRFHHEGKNKWCLTEWIAQNDVKVLRQFENSQSSVEKRRREMAFEAIQESGMEEDGARTFVDKNEDNEEE